MYIFMLGKLQLPIAPSSIKTKIRGNNKTVTLINDGEINQIKKPGLTEIEFDALLPNQKYPFAQYKIKYEPAKFFLDELEKLKLSNNPFQFIVVRTKPNAEPLFDDNIKVTLEDYTITEDVGDYGFDVGVSVSLKQYRNFGTKTFKINKKKPGQIVKKKPVRPAKKTSKNKIYTVKKGDCLWTISKRYYGKGSLWKNIYNANKKKIKNPNLIYPGQKFIIPPLKK